MKRSASPYYDTDRAVADYLLFHYGTLEQTVPFDFAVPGHDYLARCVRLALKDVVWPDNARALDLGCAVGRASFELARHATQVIGIDLSRKFIAAAQQLQHSGRTEFNRLEEGARTTRCHVTVPLEIDRTRVHFETGDALALAPELGTFDVVFAANLIDRLPEPGAFLDRCYKLVKPGGHLVLASPYTWTEEYTPRENWLGGVADGPLVTGNTIATRLQAHFTVAKRFDLPFLLREHARKYQWSVAEVLVFTARTE